MLGICNNNILILEVLLLRPHYTVFIPIPLEQNAICIYLRTLRKKKEVLFEIQQHISKSQYFVHMCLEKCQSYFIRAKQEHI